ncbi:sugar transporter [Pseudomonas sp. OIL-1]|uniref:sugar transporter n=1 Tax=Pseudomonas sp. OIL-1 TaxID=2706126 RepID=UPI0013A71D1B|nr:sugar transporter [Pseudomonas sp. OIL-1]QIB52607.1 sugar transporter [Pseudomonas sp. OIL-1]
MNSSTFFGKLLLYVPVKLVPAFLGIYFIFLLYSLFPEGGYVNYSVGVVSALIAAQLSSAWIGNSYIYYAAGAKSQPDLFYSCLWTLIAIAPIAASIAGLVSIFFVEREAFISVSILCFSQILFFFLSAVFQAGFLVKHQLVAVVIQATGQVVVMLVLFEYVAVSYKLALASLSVGYFGAVLFLLFVKIKEYGPREFMVRKDVYITNLRTIYRYGAALSPWMLGMLVMAAADRFAIGYYNLEGGDEYLSLKDLFVGGAGLLSMPLLMMVHSLLINRFREGHFAMDIVQASVSFLVISFTAFWVFLHFLGLEIFALITEKPVGITRGTVFLAFVAIFLASVSVYIQKRLEVHRKIGRLALLSLGCAVVSIAFAFAAGAMGGVFGVAVAAVLAQFLYLAALITSLKKISLLSFYKPVLWAFLLLGSGEVLSYFLADFRNALGYWQASLIWFAVFSSLILLALWKGVSWNAFTQGPHPAGMVKRSRV